MDVKIKFTRDTVAPREGDVAFKRGDVAEVSRSSADHWIKRRAAVEVTGRGREVAAAT